MQHFFVQVFVQQEVVPPTRIVLDGHARTNTIDTVYGSHTRHRAKHLASVAQEIHDARKKSS
jgi:regulator of extracellular matrix RemA (YlzA/DUF370 family)